MNKLIRWLDLVFSAARWLTVFLLTLMVAVQSYEIAVRTITGNTPSWAKELALLAMVWMGCLGAAALHRERGHITIEFLVDRMRPDRRRKAMIMVDMLVAVFASFLLVAGSVVAGGFLHQDLPGTSIPVGVSYLPLPVTGLLLLAAALEHLFTDYAASGEAGHAG
jgi:TRAP-type C4-dicarboxylate transport system permease small subunit